MKLSFPRLNFWLLLFFLLTLFSLLYVRISAQALSLDILPGRTITVDIQVPTVSPTPLVPAWNFIDKLQEAKNLTASSSFVLNVAKKNFAYREARITRDKDGGIISATLINRSDPEREIALILLDTNSGDLETVKINEKGNEITAPKGYVIKNVARPSGITNNAWNTCRQIVVPLNKVVILNVWPHTITVKVAKPVRNKAGKVIRTTYVNKETVENVVYSPYCDNLHISDFYENGKEYRKNITQQAYQFLKDNHVRSQAFPNKLIADLEYLKPEYFERLPLIEHMDFGEFMLDSKKSAERVDVILGTNLEQAYNLTCSGKKACGWLQYTSGTWNDMKRKYPSAKLPAFESGVKDHVMSMVAAILLHDNNLNAAIKSFGPSILNDSAQLEEMLAANYNGGTARPYKALKASILGSLEDWLINPMRKETQQYIEKLRYVREKYN